MNGRRQVVVGVGNRFRRDDAAGLHVAEWLRDHAPSPVEILTLEGEPTTLLDVFDSAALVVLVDAVATAGAAGSIHRFDATDEPVPGSVFGASTHAFGLAETIELARTLGKLGGAVLVYGITGTDFSAGEGLSAAVAEAVQEAGAEILHALAQNDMTVPEENGAPHA